MFHKIFTPNQTVKVKIKKWEIDGISVDYVLETKFKNYSSKTKCFVKGLKYPVKIKRVRI